MGKGYTPPDENTSIIDTIKTVQDGGTSTDTSTDGTPLTGTIEGTVPQTTYTPNEELQNLIEGQVTNPTLPDGTSIADTYTNLADTPDQYMTGDGSKIDSTQQATAGQIGTVPEATATTTTQPDQLDTSTYQADLIGNAAQMDSAQGTVSDNAIVKPEDIYKGVVSEGGTVDLEAVQGKMVDEAYVINQLSSLLDPLGNGEIPAWAQPAVGMAESMLNARGIGRSSAARDSLYTAIISSAMPIAQADAETARTEWIYNMDAKNKAIMFNASMTANMDLQNASFAQQMQAQNAQAFLQMDFMNLTNEQRTRELNMQAQQQVLLSDQAATNAAKQFNASSENQMNQFMTSLRATIDQQNADRLTAISQFNASQSLDAAKTQAQLETTVSQFNSQLEFNRQTFNAQNALLIEQSNVDWRRRMNEIDTAGINAANQADAMNMFNLSNQALTMLWQQERDIAQWAWQSSENSLDRANRIAIATMSNAKANKMIDKQTWTDIGALALGFWDVYNNNG